MNITLTQKDADFVLSLLRSYLNKIITSVDEVNEQYEELQKRHKEEAESNFIIGQLMNTASIMKADIDKDVAELKGKLERSIERLMCGSEVKDETSSIQ